MSDVRLQKFLAECGLGSRRKMEQFITEGRVRINGQVVTKLGSKVNPDTDTIEVNRKRVRMAIKGIMLLHKPRGVVSTLSDPEGRRTVADYLTKHYRSYFPVGRLDWDSTGLIVLTNDGEIAEHLMHPRFGFERIYHARVEGTVSQELLAKIEKGIKLSDGVVKANASLLRGDDKSTWVEIKIHEGRNRVVRRLFEKLEHPVMKLKRVVYGPFKLGSLQVGQVRVLTRKEYEEVRRKILRVKESAPGEEQKNSFTKQDRSFSKRAPSRSSPFKRRDGAQEKRDGSRRKQDGAQRKRSGGRSSRVR